MMNGRTVDELLIKPLQEGPNFIIKSMTAVSLAMYVLLHSYLRGLVPIYDSAVKRDLIEPLRAKADGSTRVPMKTEFSRISLQVISQVT